MAHGVLIGHSFNAGSKILRVTHRGSTKTADLTLVLECASGEQLSAPWNSSSVLADLPQELQFVEEAKDSPLMGTEQPLPTSKALGRLSEAKDWILDERDRKILWIPSANRGWGDRWHGRRLIIPSLTGLLTLVDFSNAILDDDIPF